MFVIVAYDVNQKRVGKVLKVCRKYLVHVQKSVFEGVLTERKLDSLKRELKSIIDFDDDGICIYSTDTLATFSKQMIGKVDNNSNII